MKTKWMAFLTCIALCLSLSITSVAAMYVYGLEEGTKPALVTDLTGVLTNSQVQSLNEKAQKVTAKYKCDVAILVVDDINDYNMERNAREIFKTYGYGYNGEESGVFFLLSPNDRAYSLFVADQTRDLLSDYDQNEICIAVEEKLKDEDYNGAAETFISKCDQYLSTTAETAIKVAVAVLVPLLIAFVICSIWKSQMKTAVKKTTAHDYIPKDGFVLKNQSDMFLYRTQTRMRVQSSSSSGGSRSSGRGSSGRSGRY